MQYKCSYICSGKEKFMKKYRISITKDGKDGYTDIVGLSKRQVTKIKIIIYKYLIKEGWNL